MISCRNDFTAYAESKRLKSAHGDVSTSVVSTITRLDKQLI